MPIISGGTYMIDENIFTVGGTVQASNGLYISRRADVELLALCREGKFAYVLTPRQLGKSSLMVRTAQQLTVEGVRSVIIDLSRIGVQVSAEAWYLGLLSEMEEQLAIETDVIQWWRERAHLGVTQRLTKFFEEVLLNEVSAPVVVFVDEIDTTLSLNFTDDFFAAIRYFYNARSVSKDVQRLSFVLIGVATPGDLIRDPQRTPFNIGQRVDLTDFTLEEALPLAAGLHLEKKEAQKVLGWVMKWTGGHPYLTQRLCRALMDEGKTDWSEADIDALVEATFLGKVSEQDNNLQFVRDMLTKRAPNLADVLYTYRDVLRQRGPVRDEEQSAIKSHLKLSGAARPQHGNLYLRNPIYAEVFNEEWVRDHLPVNWFKRAKRAGLQLAAAVLLLAFLGAAVIAYESYERLRTANEQSNLQLATARKELDSANQQSRSAQHDRAAAKAQLDSARQQLQEAQDLKKIAEEGKSIADGLRASAEQKERDAESQSKIAEAFTKIANARELATDSEFTRNQYSYPLETSVLLAVESARRLPDAKTIESLKDSAPEDQLNVLESKRKDSFQRIDAALRDGVSRLPRLVMADEMVNDQHSGVRAAAFSPDGRYLATAAGNQVRLSRLPADPAAIKAQQDDKSFNYKDPVAALTFSPDARYLAVATLPRNASTRKDVRIRDVSSEREIPIPVDSSGSTITFSNSGKYLITANLTSPFTATALPLPLRPSTVPPTPNNAVEVWANWNTKPVLIRRIEQISSSAISMSPDERYLAVGANQLVKLFNLTDVTKDEDIRSEGPVSAMAFTSDGKYLALGTANNTLTVWTHWDATPTSITHVTYGSPITAVGFNQQTSYLAVATDNSARILFASRRGGTDLAFYDLTTFSHFDRILAMQFSPDGRYLATASVDRTARLWDVRSNREIARMSHDGIVRKVLFSSDGRYLTTASDDPISRVWEVPPYNALPTTPQQLALVRPITLNPSQPISNVMFSSRQYLATLAGDTMNLWTGWGTPGITAIQPHSHPGFTFKAIAFSPDEKFKAIAYEQSTGAEPRAKRDGVLILDSRNSEVQNLSLGETPDRAVRDVAFSPDGRWLAVAIGREIHIWENWDTDPRKLRFNDQPLQSPPKARDARNLAQPSRLSVESTLREEGLITSIAFDSQSRYLAVGTVDNDAGVWSLLTGEEIWTAKHQSIVWSVAFSPNGPYLATGSGDGTARIWNVISGQELLRLLHEDAVVGVAFSPDGTSLATSSGTLARVWNINNRQEAARVEFRDLVRAISFSPDGKYLAFANSDKSAGLWTWQSTQVDLLQVACTRLTRNLTQNDWNHFIYGEEYQKTCRELPVHRTVIDSLLKDGRMLAKQGKRQEALLKFAKASSLNPNLALNPEAEVQVAEEAAREEKAQLAASAKTELARRRAMAGDIPGAVALYREAMTIYPKLNIDPESEARAFAVEAVLADGTSKVKDGKIDEAISLFAKAQALDPTYKIGADNWNLLCWHGSLWGRSKDVFHACEKAVQQQPDESNFTDSRGVARALRAFANNSLNKAQLAEELSQAIQDLQSFASDPKKEGDRRGLRKCWIVDLRHEKNPFTAEVLGKLQKGEVYAFSASNCETWNQP
jgi:WD40 repeat protein